MSIELTGDRKLWSLSLPILTLPLWTIWELVAALGPGLDITALNVKYRDFRYVIPFIGQFGLYVSPVGFSSALLADRLHLPQAWYSLNPIVGVIDGFRWASGARPNRSACRAW